jgi:hypothetical protein
MALSGGCLCGAVRFTIAADAPLGARLCWCRVCQYLGAGSGTANAVFRKQDVSVSGPMSEYVSVAESGSVMHRRFCSQCGTSLFSEAEPRPHQIVVRVGALDDPEVGKPNAIIWANEAPSWACFDPDLTPYDGQGPAAAPVKT